MAAPTWSTDALGTAMGLVGKYGVTLAALNKRSTHDNRSALSTTVSEDVDATETTISVTSAAGMPTAYPWFGRLVYSASTPAHTHWAADTVTAVGDIVVPVLPADGLGGYQYICTARGGDFKTHASTEPTWPTTIGATVVDDQVTWTCYASGDEIVKVTNIVGSDLTVVRKARPAPTAFGGGLTNTVAAPTRVFKSGSAFHVLGTHVALTAGNALSTVNLATSDAADDIIDTASAHGLSENQRVYFPTLTGGTGLVANQVYWVVATSLAAQTFRVAASRGGTPLGFSTNITAGTVQPLGTIVVADAKKLGRLLNQYMGLSKAYGERVYEVASRKKRILTLTVIE